MAVVSCQMKMNDGLEVRRSGGTPAERTGLGWNDSSWELLRGLDVVEDLPPDAWPQDPALNPSQPAG